MKESLNEFIEDYLEQLESQTIQKGYKGLMNYLMSLRTHLLNKYPNKFQIGRFYQGYMDMSYFPITPKSLKDLKLKIGLVFNHEKIRFELWLVGQNKQVQNKHWVSFNESDWNKYKISETAQESIITHTIVLEPDFNEPDKLTQQIERAILKFIADIEDVLKE